MADDPELLNVLATTTIPTLTWTLAGTDADDFNIKDGVLTFKNGEPDFEAPTDSGRNNVYEVTVQAADEAGNTASVKVKITVENVGEVGKVNLSHPQPEVGVGLRASLTDPDKARSIKWQWYRARRRLIRTTYQLIAAPTRMMKCSLLNLSRHLIELHSEGI